MASYIVFNEGRTIRGDARKLLEQIRAQNGKENQEIGRMNASEYAQALIEDAPYFLDDGLLAALEAQEFDSEYDRALTYLAQVPTSGIRILNIQNGHRRSRAGSRRRTTAKPRPHMHN